MSDVTTQWPLRVLRVSGGLSPAIGGPFVSTLASCAACARNGQATTVVAPDLDGGACSTRGIDGVEVRLFPLRARRWSFSPALAFWLLRNARLYDVVHTHGAWTFTTLAAVAAGQLARRPVVLTPHESLTDFDVAKSSRAVRAVKRATRRLLLRAADAVVFASEVELAGSTSPPARTRLFVVPHPVAELPVARLAPGERPLHVGYLGRLDPKKNLDVLFRALPAGAILCVAGDGPAAVRAQLERDAERAGVAERVEWLGFVRAEQKEAFFGSIDVLAMPSAYESFGVAAAEALLAGVPVVVSPTTGLAALVERHGCGLVVEPAAGALRAALSDHRVHERIAPPTRQAIARELGADLHAAQLMAVYQAVSGGAESAAVVAEAA